MSKNKIVLKLTVARAKCQKCGFERILYFMSDYSYGERLITTREGKYCAYVNLLEESIIPEIKKYCNEIFVDNNISISQNKVARIISNVYGITCDDINGEKVDTSASWKCSNCEEGQLEEDKDYGEKLLDVEATYVSHDNWSQLNEYEKRQKIEEELKRQK